MRQPFSEAPIPVSVSSQTRSFSEPIFLSHLSIEFTSVMVIHWPFHPLFRFPQGFAGLRVQSSSANCTPSLCAASSAGSGGSGAENWRRRSGLPAASRRADRKRSSSGPRPAAPFFCSRIPASQVRVFLPWKRRKAPPARAGYPLWEDFRPAATCRWPGVPRSRRTPVCPGRSVPALSAAGRCFPPSRGDQ